MPIPPRLPRRLVAMLTLEHSGGFRAFVRVRRALSSLRIATGNTRHTHAESAKRPNASQPRRRSRTHFAALHVHGFAAESSAAYLPDSDGHTMANTKGHESSIR